MRILASSRSLLESAGPFAVGIGIFDGVHIGHRVLLERLRDLAERDRVASLVYTFSPHPCAVTSPENAPKLLEPIEIRIEQFAELGIHNVLVERFDAEFAAIDPERFIEEILVGKLRVRHVVVGAGFTFGSRGRGDTDLLAQAGERLGYEVSVIDPVEVDGSVVSSTRIRALVTEGRVVEAARLLGRPYALAGLVMRGAMRGKSIGFATANLEPHNEVLPATGVYAVQAAGPFGTLPAVMNIGVAPTFGNEILRIEVHLLDYRGGELYGWPLTVQLVERLRGEQKFDSVEALKAQIQRDIHRARAILSHD